MIGEARPRLVRCLLNRLVLVPSLVVVVPQLVLARMAWLMQIVRQRSRTQPYYLDLRPRDYDRRRLSATYCIYQDCAQLDAMISIDSLFHLPPLDQ